MHNIFRPLINSCGRLDKNDMICQLSPGLWHYRINDTGCQILFRIVDGRNKAVFCRQIMSKWRKQGKKLAVKDSRCTRSAILNLTASEIWVPVLDRKKHFRRNPPHFRALLVYCSAMSAKFSRYTVPSFTIELYSSPLPVAGKP